MTTYSRARLVAVSFCNFLLFLQFTCRATVAASTERSKNSPGCPTADENAPQALKIAVLLPMPNRQALFDPSWNEGDKVLPSLFLAMDQINNRTELLPCHRLELVPVDGGCDIASTTAVGTAMGLLDRDERRVVGIVGAGCSSSSIQVGHVVNQPQIQLVHIHGGGTPLLSDRNTYINSLGILGSTQSFVRLSVELMKKNEWHNIAILFESGRVYYRSTKDAFLEELKNIEYNVNVQFESPVYSTFYPLDGVRISLSRIIFLFTALNHTQRILCLAYKLGLFHPAYQWVIISHRLYDIANKDSTENITFTYDRKEYSCSPAAIANMVMHGTFLINYQLSLNDSLTDLERPRLANTTFAEFLKLYDERAMMNNVSSTIWAYYFYDAVWAWARVLDRMMKKFGSEIYDDFQYGNQTIANLTLEEFYASDFKFEGMSGSISFNKNSGFYDRTFNLYQVVNGNEVHVSYSNGSTITAVNGVTPIVVSDIVRADTSVNLVLIVFFEILQLFLLIVIAILHILTVRYREEKSVKASSPKLTHFAFAGAYFFLIGLIMFLFLRVRMNAAEVSGPICHTVWVWLFPISLTLILGMVALRTWRLYRIFTHYLNPGKLLSNKALITMLIVLLSIDIIIAVVWTAIDRRELRITTDTIQIDRASELVVIRECRSRYDRVWLSIALSYKLSLLVVMVFLTLLTRRIPNKTFATTTLRVFSYTFSVVFVIGLVLYFFFLFFASARFRLNPNISTSILHTTGIVLTFLCILCIFGPPLIPVIHGMDCTKSLLKQFTKICGKERKRKPSVYDQDSEEPRVRKTSADALL